MKEIEFKAGDKVFSFETGFGTLEETSPEPYILRLNNKTYTVDGLRSCSDKHRSLLTIEEAKALGIEIPKKKVEVNLWSNIYPDGTSEVYSTRENADECSSKYRIACVELTGEYFVEDV